MKTRHVLFFVIFPVIKFIFASGLLQAFHDYLGCGGLYISVANSVQTAPIGLYLVMPDVSVRLSLLFCFLVMKHGWLENSRTDWRFRARNTYFNPPFPSQPLENGPVISDFSHLLPTGGAVGTAR